ncbi:MAG: hypothetical protein KBE65_20625 [Phycisphaerae bacterium]|nr:hypothetical protein [Phycisphaerae bacterium]
MGISQDTLRQALEQFRESRDYLRLLHTLSDGKQQVNDLLLLQHALQTTNDPDLRDMLDDAAWACANKQPLPRRPSEESVDRAVEDAVQAYGPLITEVLPDLRELVGAFLTQPQTPLPLNAVIAAIGFHAQREAEVFPVSEDNFGEETRYFSVNCDKCGGDAGGKGHIVCPKCSQRAREGLLRGRVMEQINQLPASRRLEVDVGATMANNMTAENLAALPQGMIAKFMREHPGQYGCASCNHNPAEDCVCAKTVQVPDECPDGWIVQGTRPATRESFYAVLRVRE